MKLLFLSGLITGLVAHGADAALQAGVKAPDFSVQASLAGKEFTYSLKEKLQEGPVVVYFYPSAYTRGCNIQARQFSVHSEAFAQAGASIVGVSLDGVDRLKEYSADPEFCAGKFPVASDADGKVAKSFDLEVRPAEDGKVDTRGASINHGFAERTTFVIAPSGEIAASIGGVSPADNVQKALEVVRGLAGGQGS